MIKNKLDNYLIPPQNDHLVHIDPKLCTKCPPGLKLPIPKQLNQERQLEEINNVQCTETKMFVLVTKRKVTQDSYICAER